MDLPCQVTCPVRRVTRAQFKATVNSVTPQGLAAVVHQPLEIALVEPPQPVTGNVLVCENVQDPGNVGTLIRTAAALDFSGVMLNEQCADPFGPKAVQAAAGSTLSLWIRRGEAYLQQVQALAARGHEVIAATLDGDPTVYTSLRSPAVLMVGSEGAGLSAAACTVAHRKIKIPMNRQRAESLNVAVAGAICMHRLYCSQGC